MVRFSSDVFDDLKVIRDFLFQRMYRAPRVVEMRAEVTDVVAVDTELHPGSRAATAVTPGGQLFEIWETD